MDRDGGCVCGAVRFTAKDVGAVSACHCGMCARWSGGILLSAFVSEVDWHARAELRTYVSSEWAARSFCGACGSALLWRMTHPNLRETMSVPVGALDDRSGLELTREWFVDRKPDFYALAGDRPEVTESEAFAMLEDAIAKKKP
ncbi:MAG: GFA family protein [Sandaracinaceae bacterium]